MFDSIWPIGDVRADIRACVLANAIRGGLGAQGVPLKRFALKLDTPSERKNRVQLRGRAVLDKIADMLGLRVKERRGE